MNSNFDLAPAQWVTLRRLLDEALDRPPAERTTWVDALAPDYEALKPRLHALLAFDVRGTSALPLDSLPRIETAQFLADRRTEADGLHAGGKVGPYRLVRLLGEGGMGEVWLAERTDMLHKRQVALKLPRLLTGRAALAERMAREREILAGLDHPNIARLYDAGVTADGQPYLALEYVEGERIDAYCARGQLDVPARLRLFLQVARAVAHAHANLVVHRDLKPTNILVTAAGDVKLLDFGIAKLLEDGRAAETELTQLAGRALTPDYAAPEQILGQPIGTAADVYALGVVLFELLTGTRPYQLKRESRAALEEAIVQAEPARPSSVVAEPKLRRRLQGDLDTIVLKALKKAPSERYGTVQALSEELERYLEGRPVLAQADSRFYRLRKFVARNRLAVGAAAAVLLAIVTGAGVAVWQAREAQAEQQRAEEVRNFIASIFRDASPYQASGKPLTGLELLKLAKDRIDRIDPARVGQRVELLNLLAASLLSLEDPKTAETVLVQALSEAAKGLPSDDPQQLRARRLMSQVHRAFGRVKDMRRELEQILPALRSRVNKDPEELVAALVNEVNLEIVETRFDEAETTAREGLQVIDRKLGGRSAFQVPLLTGLFTSYRMRGKSDLALEAAERAFRVALDLQNGNAQHPTVASARTFLANAFEESGHPARAVQEAAAAVADTAAVFGPTSRIVGIRTALLAERQITVGAVRDAEKNATAAIDILGKHLEPGSRTYAAAVEIRGLALLAARRGAEAAQELDRARTVYERIFGPGTMMPATVTRSRALALALAGRVDEAERDLQALAGGPRLANDAYDVTSQVLGAVELLQGRPDAAVPLLQKAEGSMPEGIRLAISRYQLQIQLGIGQVGRRAYADAVTTLERALRQHETLRMQASPQWADAMVAMGRAQLGLNRAVDAQRYLEQADAFWRDFDPDNRWAGEAAFWLGRSHAALGRASDARQAYARAAKILARSPMPGDGRLVEFAHRG